MARLIQYFAENGAPAVGLVEGRDIVELGGFRSLVQLAFAAMDQRLTLDAMALAQPRGARERYDGVLATGRVRPVVDGVGAPRLMVTGTGLTHLGSVQARDAMHSMLDGDDSALSDSMKIFKMGVQGGKPAAGQVGVQPEWFWKGDASILRGAGQWMDSPHWAMDFGEEPEIAGIYLIDPQGKPCRLGFALANEMSDHAMERQNYLFLAHSKLRPCALGPELLTGDLPRHVEGTSRIYRKGAVIWEKPFLSGEDNMTHSIANLEHHHFKYPLFRQPGDVHVHVFGTATISFADGVRLQEADEMEIDCPVMGHALRNPVHTVRHDAPTTRSL